MFELSKILYNQLNEEEKFRDTKKFSSRFETTRIHCLQQMWNNKKGWKKGNERVCVIERECAVCVSDKKDRERMCACVREKECVCETREYL